MIKKWNAGGVPYVRPRFVLSSCPNFATLSVNGFEPPGTTAVDFSEPDSSQPGETALVANVSTPPAVLEGDQELVGLPFGPLPTLNRDVPLRMQTLKDGLQLVPLDKLDEPSSVSYKTCAFGCMKNGVYRWLCNSMHLPSLMPNCSQQRRHQRPGPGKPKCEKFPRALHASRREDFFTPRNMAELGGAIIFFRYSMRIVLLCSHLG